MIKDYKESVNEEVVGVALGTALDKKMTILKKYLETT